MEKLLQHEIDHKLETLPGWSYQNGAIEKQFRFKDFKQTFTVMTRIAFEAEAYSHHPDWSNVYNQLTIRLNTHDVGGITTNDFELAQRIEECIKQM